MDTRPEPLAVALIAAPSIRRHCRAILSRAGEAAGCRGADLSGAGRLVATYRPAAVLLDALTSPLRALFLLPTLKRLSPASSIVVIGGASTPVKFILAALRRGACGHIAAGDLARDLPKALRTVAGGEPWLSRQLGAALVAELRHASHDNAATPDTGQGRARVTERAGMTVPGRVELLRR